MTEKQVLFRIEGKLLDALDKQLVKDGYSTRNAWFKEAVGAYTGKKVTGTTKAAGGRAASGKATTKAAGKKSTKKARGKKAAGKRAGKKAAKRPGAKKAAKKAGAKRGRAKKART